MTKKNNVEDDDSTYDDGEIIESITSAKGNSKARRQLEKILEDKALERLINGDFYD